jgi:hypothetical protein
MRRIWVREMEAQVALEKAEGECAARVVQAHVRRMCVRVGAGVGGWVGGCGDRCMYMCMFIYIYACICVCLYTYMHVCVCVGVGVCVCVCVCVCVWR